MSSRPIETSGAAWSRSSGRGSAVAPAWRRVREGPRRRRRGVAVGLTGAAFLTFSGLLLWVVLWLWPPSPACLVLIGAGYETNLAVPQNVYGRDGLKGLADLTRLRPESALWRSRRMRLVHEPTTLHARGAWARGLATCPEKTVILVLALHGGTDERGAYLLADDADTRDDPPDAPESHRRLRVSAVLDALKTVPATKNKILVLDATQVSAHWPLGLLHNDFARELERLDERIAGIENLVVLSASGTDQRSWVSEEWRQTVFTHYLIEGLKGAAGNADGRVDALGLHRYVSRHVANWASANRQALQTPILLPRGPEGETRARRIELAVSRKKYEPPDPAKVPEFAVPGALREAWETYERLRARHPVPEVYTPHLWRRYLASLLRFEELELAGDAASAKTMRGKLSELERALADARVLPLRSAQNTLVMSAAEGRQVPAPSESLRLRFNELWSAPPEEYARRWERMQVGPGAPPKSETGVLRLQLLDDLRNNAADGSAESLLKAARLARVLDDPAHPRPAEIHDLIMLGRDLVPDLSRQAPGLIRKSIEVRRLAEATALDVQADGHPYSEQVVPWVRPLLDEADAARRPGQDLLFASDARRWEEAGGLLDRAERLYRQAQADETVVRSALRFRDEVQPVLPYYAHGLGVSATDRSLSELESLGLDLHTFVRDLEQPDPGLLHPAPSVAEPRPRALKDRLERLQEAFEALEGRLTRTGQTLARKGETPSDWRAIDALLRVPFVLPQEDQADSRPLRLMLLDKRRELGRKFLKAFDPAQDVAPPLTVEENTRAAQDEARRQGVLALAVLGADWFDDCPPAEGPSGKTSSAHDDFPEKFAAVRDRVREGVLGAPERPFLLAGERIAHRWRQLPVAVAAALARPNRSARLGEKFDGREALDSLRKADRLARRLDGPGAEQLERELKRLPPSFAVRDPLAAYRKLRVQDLVVAQAKRALDDHWYGDAPESPPYYQAAGLAYLDDAEKLDPLGMNRRLLQDLVRRLKAADGLTLVPAGPLRPRAEDGGGPERVVTSEQRLDLAFGVRADPGAPARHGFPVFWFAPESADDPLRRVAPIGDERIVLRVGEPSVPLIPTRWVSKLTPDDGPQARHAGLTVEGRFRGQVLKRVTKVDVYPLAETVAAQHPMPEAGGIAVRASDDLFKQYAPSNGAVAIVLDCSGSMGAAEGESFGPATKYRLATDALEILLRGLPTGTIVSLWVFGAAAPDRAEVQAEETIKQVLKPVAWGPDLLEPLMEQVRFPRLEPWNLSPIVRTMWRAKGDLVDAPGSKTMLVITDGADDRFDGDRALNRDNKLISGFLRETFADTGISVNVVAVTGPLEGGDDPARTKRREEATRARAQFEVIQDLPVPGRFYALEDAGQLIDKLREALRQDLTYRILAGNGKPVLGLSSRAVSVSRIGANDQWFPGPLLPGGYMIQLQSDKRQYRGFELNRGDLLLVTLAAGPGGDITFGRALYSQEYFPNSVENTLLDEAGEWRLSVLQNQRLEGSAVRMLVTLEKQPDRRETVLALARPRETWIEVEPDARGTSPLSLRWENREHYPAPAWSVALKNWPAARGTTVAARPRVRAWWNPDIDTLRAVPLARGKDFRIDAADEDSTVVQVDGGDVVIEGVRIERHRVQVAANAQEERTCLVVRLAHPAGRPVWARLPGVDLAGHEHRFYAEAGKYTGLFWTKTEDEVRDSVNLIDLIALDRFKEACESNKHRVALNRLPPPQPDSAPPPEFLIAR